MERPKFVDKMMRRVPMFYGPAAMDEICAYIEALEKDAARYRLLRSEAYEAVIPHGGRLDGKRTAWITKLHPGDSFDAAIDAALAASDPQRGSEAQG
jgi:hypothetical protein